MAASMPIPLACSLVLAATYFVSTAAQQMMPCTAQCEPPPNSNNSWVSDIMAIERATSVRLEWEPDTTSQMNGDTRYVVVWRNAGGMENFRMSQNTRNTNFGLNSLQPETRYTALVCRPGVNVSAIPLPPEKPLVPECGFCSVCFETVAQQYTFERTELNEVNDTYVNLTCRVRSNADFDVFWRAIALDSETMRTRLDDRDRYDGRRVAVTERAMMSGMDTVVISSLVAPHIVLEQDVRCVADSNFESAPSAMGAFVADIPPDTVPPDEVTSSEVPPEESTSFPEWVIAVVVVVAAIITIVAVVAVLVCVVQKMKSKKKSYKDIAGETRELRTQRSTNDYLGANIVSELSRNAEKLGGDEERLSASFDVDLPEYMVIDRSSISVTTVIGQGEFGVVYKGHLRRGSVSELVAVKSLKGIFVTENDVQNALKEISKMKNFDHPNVMTLVGVCKATEMSGGAPSIIMPYMARGSLLNYLRKERDGLMLSPDVDVTQVGAVQKLLMQICLQISKGMAYLASLRFVHRDLAARNCMIDDKGIIKVADFGLAEDIYMRNYFRQTSQDTAVKLPLKWMAPESIKLGIFSEKSDVWSYGVTCWEVFTAGEIPYPGIHALDVMQLLEEGQHLSKPNNQACSNNMFSLMQSCWKYNAKDRPDFLQLSSQLDNQLTAFAEYIELSISPRNSTKAAADTIVSFHDPQNQFLTLDSM